MYSMNLKYTNRTDLIVAGACGLTLVTLLIVPATYLMLEDGLKIARKLGWSESSGEPVIAEA